MDAIVDGSVALVVTSPPYFAGKQYEEELEREGVPSSYVEYLQLLTDVFAECARKLEPGGRIAVNVANLGRKPYRSLSADVIGILQDDLHLLLRGEVDLAQGRGRGRQLRVGFVPQRGQPGAARHHRARRHREQGPLRSREVSRAERERRGLPVAEHDRRRRVHGRHARRVGHPARERARGSRIRRRSRSSCPLRLIDLYTYENDLVLDPFMGSGSTLVAAARLGRRYVGYDLDPTYVDIARLRVRDEGRPRAARRASTTPSPIVGELDFADSFQARAAKEGKAAQALAEGAARRTPASRSSPRTSGCAAPASRSTSSPRTRDDVEWYFDVSGAFTSTRGGLLRTDTVWKTLGRAHVLRGSACNGPLVFLTSHLPRKGSEGDIALRRPPSRTSFFDAIEMRSAERLRTAAQVRGRRHSDGRSRASA